MCNDDVKVLVYAKNNKESSHYDWFCLGTIKWKETVKLSQSLCLYFFNQMQLPIGIMMWLKTFSVCINSVILMKIALRWIIQWFPPRMSGSTFSSSLSAIIFTTTKKRFFLTNILTQYLRRIQNPVKQLRCNVFWKMALFWMRLGQIFRIHFFGFLFRNSQVFAKDTVRENV